MYNQPKEFYQTFVGGREETQDSPKISSIYGRGSSDREDNRSVARQQFNRRKVSVGAGTKHTYGEQTPAEFLYRLPRQVPPKRHVHIVLFG